MPYSLSDSDGRSNVIEISGSAPAPTPPDPNSCVGKSVNDECRGGIIFETDGVNGLIVSNTNVPDNSTVLEWGCSGTSISGAQSDTDGAANTAAIVAGCNDTPIAAKACNNYSVTSGGMTYDNWYLPAKNELAVLYTKRTQSNINITSGFYWSSTEFDEFGAWFQSFSNSNPFSNLKGVAYDVRCIQAF